MGACFVMLKVQALYEGNAVNPPLHVYQCPAIIIYSYFVTLAKNYGVHC